MFGAKYGQQGFSIFSIFLLFSFSGCIGGGGGGWGGQVQFGGAGSEYAAQPGLQQVSASALPLGQAIAGAISVSGLWIRALMVGILNFPAVFMPAVTGKVPRMAGLICMGMAPMLPLFWQGQRTGWVCTGLPRKASFMPIES